MSDDDWVHFELGPMTCGGCQQPTSAWAQRRKGTPAGPISINCKCGHVNEWPLPAT